MESTSHFSDAWEVYPQITRQQFQAARARGIEPLLAQLLYNRGVRSVDEMAAFIAADYASTRDPLMLIDMPRALDRIRRALSEEEHITVYGDYDADGVTSSSLLFRALRRLKSTDAVLDFHIPHRLRDGCGLNLAAIDLLKQRGTSLIITTDCASSDVEQVAYANSLGIDVIITDHHHPPAQLPAAYAMVNPWRPECTYGERYLCGAGIAFKLVQALYRSYGLSSEDEQDLLDLVAIGTIADIAPLLGENHILVHLGMQRLNEPSKPGLRALMQVANLVPGRLKERDIAFGLGPRINAAGRMQEARLAFELLTTEDEQVADALAHQLEQLNIERQQQTETLMKHVRDQATLQPSASVVLAAGNDWHEGIIGLVAGKLADELKRPVLVLSSDPQTRLSRGSARSQQNFNIIEALRGFGDQLERYGGHAQAAGFTIQSERIESLRAYLLKWQATSGQVVPAIIEGTALPDQTGVVLEQEPVEAESSSVTPAKLVDLVFTRIDMLNYQTYKLLRMLGPFGAGNPEPVFKMERLRLHGTWTSGYNRQNLRLDLSSGTGNGEIKGTYMRGAGERQRLAKAEYVNIIFRIDSSGDDARAEIWLKILDVEPLPADKSE